MEWLRTVIDYVNAHPFVDLGVLLVLFVLPRLFRRKSKLARETEKRIDQLRKERGDFYRKFRPPS